jgi:hypothetical protein
MFGGRCALAFMTYCTAYLVKGVGFDIWMDPVRLRDIRHFGIVNTQMTSHAAIDDLKFRSPRLLHLQRSGKQLLLECRIAFQVSLGKLRRP